MPYLKQEDKDTLLDGSRPMETPGDLNFLLTQEVLRCVKENLSWQIKAYMLDKAEEYIEAHGLSYKTCNAIVGAFVCCKLEFKRRTPAHLWVYVHENIERHMNDATRAFYRDTVAPYEDLKIEENGEVYP